MIIVDQDYIKKIFQKRATDSSKWSHGHALIFAGSETKIGAAIITAKACLKSGAGLVTVNIPKEERLAIFASVPEAMIEFREEKTYWEKYNVFAVGPGFGIDNLAEIKIKFLIEKVKTPCVFDADALNIFSNHQQLLYELPEKSILTPHSKEFDRLFGTHSSEKERRLKAIEKAKELKAIIILKSHQTFITDGVKNFENSSGNAGLAKGGSGDALTGIITAFLAQGYESLNAAVLGVYLHGLAADITLTSQSEESMLITDVIENLGNAFKTIKN